MTELTGEQKVYSEFLTNLAVAWFSAGVIAPFFTRPRDVTEVALLAASGILGAFLSLRFAVLISRRVKNGSY
jgi:hypothetical protein